MKNQNYKISIVIPTYNSLKTLINCIKSLINQTIELSEIIVIDNGSSDNTASVIKKRYPKIKLIALKKNIGVTGGRNTGIKNAKKGYDYILFLDHDMVADKKMVAELLKVGQTNSSIGIITPKIYYYSNKKRIWSAGTSIDLLTGRVYFRGGMDAGQYDDVEEVQIAPAAMLVKKALIDKIKSFDDRYFATYEDSDFCFRARKQGFRVFYSPKAIAYHDMPIESKGESDRVLSRAYWIGRNRVLFMRDFGKNFIIFLFFIPIFGIYYLYMSIKSKRITAFFNFIRGTFDGLVKI